MVACDKKGQAVTADDLVGFVIDRKIFKHGSQFKKSFLFLCFWSVGRHWSCCCVDERYN